MRLNGIEIVVGEASANLPTCRHLSYIVSFENDTGDECQRRHETLVQEHVLNKAEEIARIVAHVVRGMMVEDARNAFVPTSGTQDNDTSVRAAPL